MTAKIAAFLITLLVNIAIGVAVFFVLLIAMNGYSESDAMYGFGVYVVLALFVSFMMAGGAMVTVQLLMKRQFRGWVAALISVPVFSVVGALLKIGCSIIGALVAEYMRVNY